MQQKKTNRYLTQADRICAKFGGARRLAAAMKASGSSRHPSTVYKWTYPKAPKGSRDGGTGGLIPTSAWPDVLRAAAYEGIFLSEDDKDPRPRLTHVPPRF